MFSLQQQDNQQTYTSPNHIISISFDRIRTLHDINLKGKSVLLRADLDVLPLISDDPDSRLTSLKKSVDHIFTSGAKKIILLGHIGRPKKRDVSLSTQQLIFPLEKILKRHIPFSDDFGQNIDGEVILFENLRFWPEETEHSGSKTRIKFAKSLAEMGQIYINDAFGTCHRNHPSMVDIAMFLPSAIGLQVEKEIALFKKVLQRPRKEFVAIIGGAKIETKLPMINRFAQFAEYVLVGGILPSEIKNQQMQFPPNVYIADIKKTIPDITDTSAKTFAQIIQQAKTIVWNGPMGVFEKEKSSHGTDTIAYSIINAMKNNNALSVAGGGETEKYLRSKKLVNALSHTSNGGGALLQLLSGNKLIALEPLKMVS